MNKMIDMIDLHYLIMRSGVSLKQISRDTDIPYHTVYSYYTKRREPEWRNYIIIRNYLVSKEQEGKENG